MLLQVLRQISDNKYLAVIQVYVVRKDKKWISFNLGLSYLCKCTP